MEGFLRAAAALPPLAPNTAKAFDTRKGILTERVNQELLGHPHLEELIGTMANGAMMLDNHRNHALFLASVLALNGWRLLASTLPWVYRTYRFHGFRPEYFRAELEAWKKAIRAELAPEEADPIVTVYDWMLNQHEFLVSLSQPGKEAVAAPPRPAGEAPWFPFFRAILARDLNQALAQAKARVERPEDLAGFYQDIVRPALYEVGNRWERGELTVAEEHLASAVAATVIAAARCHLVTTAARRGRAVVAAVTGELHDMGARMVSHCLEADGWEVSFLGANSPLSDLVGFTQRLRPRVVGLSIAMPYHLHHAQAVIDQLRQVPELAGMPVLLGGQVFSMLPEARGLLRGGTMLDGCPAAVVQARALC